MKTPPKKKNIWKRIARITAKTIVFIVLFFILLIVLIQTGPVQNFIRKKAVAYLEKKLGTKVEIGRVYIGLPKNIVLENIYIEDKQQDTLLSGGKIKVNLNLLRLLFKKDVDFKNIELDNITVKVKRQLPDTAFNFQFIIDAFASKDNSETDKSSSPSSSSLAIHSVTLDKIRLVYKDVITGNDAEAWLDHFDTRIDKFDLPAMVFEVPATHVEGLTARIYQTKPLAVQKPEAERREKAKEPVALQLDLGNIDLDKIKLDYRNDVSSTYASLDLGKLNVKPRKLDLTNKIIDLRNVSLESTTAVIRLGNTQQAKVVENETKEEVKVQKEAGWQILVASIDLNNNDLQFDNDNQPKVKTGMDYAHLKTNDLILQVKDFLFSKDSIAGNIKKASFNEQSGFVLNELETEFLYTSRQAYLNGLYLKTPGTELKRKAAIQYASIESLQNDIGNMQVDLDLQQSKVLVKDILIFAPSLREQPAFADPNTTWYVNTRITGKLSDLNIDALQVQGLKDTKIDLGGNITGLPNTDKAYANLSIRNITSSRRDVELFVPKKTLPQNITLPGRMNISGDIKGNAEQMKTNILLATDLGDASVKGSFKQISDSKHAGYDVVIETRSIDLGTILQDKETLGPVTARFAAKGNGYDPKTANATINGVIHSAVFKKYNYKDLKLDGKIADQNAELRAGITDANIDFELYATADFSSQYPAVKMTTTIDSIKMQPLHLATETRIYRGKIEADFPVTNPDSLQGNLYITQLLLIQQNKRLQLDTVQLSAGRNDTVGQYIRLNSQVVNAALEGKYKITELGNVFQQAIQPYFAVAFTDSIKVASYDFTLNAYILDNPALKVFVPDLERLDSVSLRSHFSNDSGWVATVKAPAIDVGTNHVRNLQIEAGTNDNAVDVKARVERITSGSGIEVNNTTLTTRLSQNNIDFVLNIKDKASKDKYHISGILHQPGQGNYELVLQPNNLLLNYSNWTLATDNKILIAKDGINANNFLLSRSGQQLKINSISAGPNAPMEMNFNNFKLATLTGFVQSDSTLVDGLLNGKITFTELDKEPIFKGDLTVNDLSIKNDTAGNVHILVDNRTPNTYAVDITLNGRGNDVKLSGNYYVALVNNKSFDFDLDINKLPLTTAQAFSAGAIRNASGSVNGKFNVTGTVAKPAVNGDLNFDQAGFNLSMLNSYFSVDKEKINVNNKGIQFNRFEIKDSAKNSLIIDGLAATSDFSHYKFDMNVRANNFRALNSTKKDNDLFYGQLYFSTNLKISGTEKVPSVDGRLAVNEKTKMTIVLPQRDPGVVDREGVVVFVDKDAPLNDSLFLASYDSLNVSDFTGMNISVNVDVDKEAEFTLIVDEGNGDFLNVKGEALLNCGIDPSGKVTLAGTYEIQEGSYELTFNFLKRKFEIQKGSRIVWEGEPTAATVDVTAVYVANAAPLDLVKNQLADVTASQRNTYLQKLPFEVSLKMEGPLLKPLISFDIQLPSDKSYVVSNDIITNVQTKLSQLRQEEGEMNKQVFSLLLLNRFMAEDPFSSSTGGPTAGMLARQSVSKLLTEQLNRLADDIVKGIDLNFDVMSSEDYTTGERRDRTDLNVGLSKQLLNDRLTVSIGSNFELEGPQNTNQQATNIAGNVAVDYRLSKDNRYLLRAYRKNEYQGVIEGYVVETGLSFIITVDYNRFREIFTSREARKEKRLRRKQNREKEKQPETLSVPAKTGSREPGKG